MFLEVNMYKTAIRSVLLYDANTCTLREQSFERMEHVEIDLTEYSG